MTSRNHALSTLACALLLCFGTASHAQNAAAKVAITKQADLPRFSYPIAGTATQFVETDAATFDAFSAKVSHDVDGVLAGYQIDDKSTLSQLLAAKLNLPSLCRGRRCGSSTRRPAFLLRTL